MNSVALAGLAITALFALGLAAFGFWNRPRHRLDREPVNLNNANPETWHWACEQSRRSSRRRRGVEED